MVLDLRICHIHSWFLALEKKKADHQIFNVGTGEGRSFNDVANAWISLLGSGEIAYVPLPDELEGKYQSFTQADTSSLRSAGYRASFTPLEEGIARYHKALETS